MASIIDFPKVGDIGDTVLPKRWDVELYQGDTFEVIFVFKDSLGTAINLTGFTGLVQIRDETTNTIFATPVVTTNADGVVGKVRVFLADTNVIPEGEYFYDLQLTDGADRARTFIGGKYTVTRDVSE